MRTAGDREFDGYLDLWARKAGFVFGLGTVARHFAGACQRDPAAISFLHTASEVTDALVEAANLVPPEEELALDGTTWAEVPNELILVARALVTHWQRLGSHVDETEPREVPYGGSLAKQPSA